MSPGAEELAGDNLKTVCKTLGIPPVLNFGPCLAIGRLEIVATELAEYLGIDLPQLPLVLSAPQWLEEQALADGAFGLALGLPLHLALPPFITGSKVVTEVLTESLKNITGDRFTTTSTCTFCTTMARRASISRWSFWISVWVTTSSSITSVYNRK